MYFRKAIMLLLPAAMFASCTRENHPSIFTGTLELSGGKSEPQPSKAYIYEYESKYYCTWESGDMMNIHFDAVGNDAHKYVFENSSPDELCNFSGSISESYGNHTIYGYYPSSACVTGSESGYSVKLTVPSAQTPIWSCSDPAADILVMKPENISISGQTQSLESIRFARIGAIVKLVPVDDTQKKILSGLNIIYSSFEVKGAVLAGNAAVDLRDASVSGWSDTASKVYGTYGKYDSFTLDDSHSVYLLVNPAAISAGDSVKFELKLYDTSLDKETYLLKKVKLDSALELEAGNVTTIGLFFNDSEIQGDPGPTPGPGGETTSLPKWPECPSTPEKKGEYYYTYHMTDVNNAQGKKARNYSVCYNKEKLCAMWVASPMHDFYAKKNTDRTDSYQNDPNFSFTQPGKWSGYTRGHLLGSAERLVSRNTNVQVFYYSNIAPQLQTYFNTGGGVWNDCEDYFCDTQWVGQKDTTYMVTGCYWDPAQTPKTVSGTEIPTHYYKIILRTKNHLNKPVWQCSRDELQCVAVMFEHKTYPKSHSILPSQYEEQKLFKTVAQMEALTGFTFFPNVPNAPKDTYDAKDWPTSK